MIPKLPTGFLPSALVLAFVLAFASSSSAQVKDDASFFSAAAVAEAKEGIQQIKQTFKKDFVVETYLKAPSKDFKAKDFEAFAEKRAETLKVDGIYLFIVKEKGHLEVVVDPKTIMKAFPVADRTQMRNLLLAKFKDKEFDKGLTGAVAFARARLEQHLGVPPPPVVAQAISDEGKFFSEETVAIESLEIKEMKKNLATSLIVETFKSPPADIAKQLSLKDAAERNKVFGAWVGQRMAASRADIHVLICREPSHIQVGLSDAALKKSFSTADRDKLVQILVAGFKAKKFDEALEKGVDFVYDTVDGKTAAPVPTPLAGTIVDMPASSRPRARTRQRPRSRRSRPSMAST